MPVPNESSVGDGWFNDRLNQLMKPPAVTIREQNPQGPAPEPILRSSVLRIVPQHRMIHTILTKAGRRDLRDIDGVLEIVIDPFASTCEPSDISVSTYGELRIISTVSAAHLIQTASGVFEFEPVRGANITIRGDIVIGAYRARRVEPQAHAPVIEEPEQQPTRKRKMFGS